MLKQLRNRNGFTLIEVLIVITIIGFLLVVFAQSLISQLEKSRDAERKSDLQEIKNAFEGYYNDNARYPEEGLLRFCGDSFEHYLKEIPCDPLDNTPYIYDPYPNGRAYRVLVKLENEDDSIIDELACGGTLGFGYLNQPQYNYGTSQGRRVSDFESNTDDPDGPSGPGSSPSPSPTPDICTGQPMIQFTCEEDNIPPTCQACGSEGCVTGGLQSGPYRCLAECIQLSICNQ